MQSHTWDISTANNPIYGTYLPKQSHIWDLSTATNPIHGRYFFRLKSGTGSMLIYDLTKFEGRGYENMKNLNHVHHFVTAFIGKIKRSNFGGEAILPTKKRLCTKFEQGKFEILWYSYFCLKFFRAFNWIPIVNIFLNLILIHSQIFCIFAITDFPPLSQCDAIWIMEGGGILLKSGVGGSIWCLFADYHCHLILTHEMKKLP